jgi:HK97 family phage portal protein
MSLFRRETRMIDPAPFTSFDVGGESPFVNQIGYALRLIPVYSANTLIADAVSMTPYSAYQYNRGARERMTPQPNICVRPHPNPIFTRIEWLQQYTSSLLLRGNAYGYILEVDDGGRPSVIQWLNPADMRVDESKPGLPRYEYNTKPLDTLRVIHIPWFPAPGSILGLSPIGQFKQQIELGNSAGKYGAEWFKKGARPSGHLKYGAGPLDTTSANIIKQRFKESVADNDVFVSGVDWDWKALSVSPEEAQFLETIKASANQIAAIYHVDPADIGGEAANSLTYATLESNQLKFQVRTLQPLYTRLETHLSLRFPDYQFIKFNPDALIRTDTKTRAEVHEINLRTGMETQAEGRALEEKPPLTPQEHDAWKADYSKAPTPTGNEGGTQGARP